MRKDSWIYVADHEGLSGSAIVRRLRSAGYENLLLTNVTLDNQLEVSGLFERAKPQYVFLPQAKVGGLFANEARPAEFFYGNLQIQTNVIHSAWKAGVEKLLFVSSCCAYPELCPRPMKEECLMTGELEPISEPSALARIAGMKMCQFYNRQYFTNFISAVPTGIFGPNDDFNPETGHVLPALIVKIHQAKEKGERKVIMRGTGEPRREFVFVDDMADACILLMERDDSPEITNIAYGNSLAIKEWAALVKDILGFDGDIEFSGLGAEGIGEWLVDDSRLRSMGWAPSVSIEEGIKEAYRWYKDNL